MKWRFCYADRLVLGPKEIKSAKEILVYFKLSFDAS